MCSTYLLKRINIPAHEIEVQQQLYLPPPEGGGGGGDKKKQHIVVDHGKINSPKH